MKKAKLLILVLSLCIFSFLIQVKGIDSMDSYDGLGSYKESEILTDTEIAYQVMHKKVLGQTKTQLDKTPSGGVKNEAGLGSTNPLVKDAFYNQQINLLSASTKDGVKVASWGFTSATGYEMRTITALARDYEEKNPGWKVLGGVNADFFDINGGMNLPYQPIGPMVSNGDSIRVSGNHNYSLMLGFTNNRTSQGIVAKKYMHDDRGLEALVTNFYLYIYDSFGNILEKFPVDTFNQAPLEDEIGVYFATWNDNKEIVSQSVSSTLGSVFVVEEALKALASTSQDFFGKGEISSNKDTVLTKGSFAIVSNRQEVSEKLALGTHIKVQREFEGEFSGVEEISSGHGFILENGQESSLLNEAYYYTRAPRTIVGQKEDGTIVMMSVDGRNLEDQFFGVTQEEMAAISKYYGLQDAYNLDGGGSTTFMVRNGDTFSVTNTPSDGSIRSVSNALFFVVYEPDILLSTSKLTKDGFVLHSEIIANNGHDIKELYVKMEDEYRNFSLDTIEFSDLESNKNYQVEVYYKNSRDEFVKTALGFILKTAKEVPKLLGAQIEFRNGTPVLLTSFLDLDQGITRLSVSLDNKIYFVIGNEAVLTGINYTKLEDFTDMVLSVRYDIQDGTSYKEFTITNPHNRCSITLNVMQGKHVQAITNILQ